jgi:hypothetical protein
MIIQLHNIKEIKNFESPVKIVKIFTDNEISEMRELYEILPLTVHNKKQKNFKKNGYKIITKN